MKHTMKSVLQDIGLEPHTWDAGVRCVAHEAAKLLNAKEDLLVQKDQQLRNARIKVLKQEQKSESLKHELIKMSELI